MELQGEKQKLLDAITADLKCIEGVKAIVLGGSYATGFATENSDLDIGIYYTKQNPFGIENIKSIAEKYAVDNNPTVTGYYEWGPWVNGGAWMSTSIAEVDLLYKNIEQITKVIDDAKDGLWENSFEQQPPYGFSSVIFLAETKCCIPLYDPDGIISGLKESVAQYPQKLKGAIIQQSLWAAEFTIWQAGKFASNDDLYTTAGCLTRATHQIVNALFALNELYPMGDKRAIEILEKTNKKPSNLSSKVNSILNCKSNSLMENVNCLKKLFHEVVLLAEGQYQPHYEL
jgi:hypothetical protein